MSGRSSLTNLIVFFDEMVGEGRSDVIYLDFKKVFSAVSLSIPLDKQMKYRVSMWTQK